MITQEYLKTLLKYDPETGLFTWLVSRCNRAKIGGEAGSLNKGHGYREINIDKKRYRAHRLAFLYIEGIIPPHDVDHINHNRDDNSWANLRHASSYDNHRNRTLQSNNSSGFNGVSWVKASKKWTATVKHDGRRICLGLFEALSDAVIARTEAEEMYGFHVNHGQTREY